VQYRRIVSEIITIRCWRLLSILVVQFILTRRDALRILSTSAYRIRVKLAHQY